MNAREFLDQYRTAYNKAARLKEKLEQLKEEYTSVGGGIIPVKNGSGINKPTERKVERVQKAFDKWASAQLDAVEIRQNIFDVINGIEDCKIADVMWFRYLGLLTWEEVCDAVGYSWCQVHKMHRQGHELLDQLIM